jgi:hypothetical protein
MLCLIDGRRSVAEICDETQISVAKGLAVVRKLSELGMIDAAPDTRDMAPVPELERAETLRGMPPLGSLVATPQPLLRPGPGKVGVGEPVQADTLPGVGGGPRVIPSKEGPAGKQRDTLHGLPVPRPVAFTAAEEAFFASEVQPTDEYADSYETLGDKISLLFTALLFRFRRDAVY